MTRRIGIGSLVLLVVCLALPSCRPLVTAGSQATDLKIESLTSPTAIPAEYGNLVAVTSSTPDLALLWFEKPDKSITIVRVNFGGGGAGLVSRSVVIPRN